MQNMGEFAATATAHGSPSITVSRDRLCRVALSLHNTGLQLLARGRVLEGREVVRDSIAVMRCNYDCDYQDNAFINNAAANGNHAQAAEEAIAAQIRKADRYLSLSSSLCGHGRPSRMLVFDEATYDGYSLHDGVVTENAFATLIRIDPTCDNDHSYNNNETVVGIMVCNYAVCHACLAEIERQQQQLQQQRQGPKATTPSSNAARFDSVAVRLYQDSFSTIQRAVAGGDCCAGSSSSSSSIYGQYLTLQIEYIVLSHLVQSHLNLGNTLQANTCCEYMVQIQDLQFTLRERGVAPTNGAEVAPAA